jgi:hypothetical protein
MTGALTTSDLVLIDRLTSWTDWHHLINLPPRGQHVVRHDPGVYMFRFDYEPDVVGYIGKSRDIRSRMGQYRRGDNLLRPPCYQVIDAARVTGSDEWLTGPDDRPVSNRVRMRLMRPPEDVSPWLALEAYREALPWSGLQVKIGYAHEDQILTLERLLIHLYDPPWNHPTYSRQRHIFDAPASSR